MVFAVPPSNLSTGFAGMKATRSVRFEVEYEVFKQACLDYLDLQEGDLGYEENMSLDQHQSRVLGTRG